MNKTEWWAEEARTLLRQFVRSPRPTNLERLKEHVGHLELDKVLAHLGCGDGCSSCSWGELGGFQLREACSLVSFLESLKDASPGGASLRSLQPGAMTLLSVLDGTSESRRV
jgi:hypothetical protein